MVKDRQVKELRHWLQKEATLSLAALKTGMDRKTARKYRRGQLPSEAAREHDWQTRPDAFAEVWDEVESLLQVATGIEAKKLFADLQRRYPGRFQIGLIRMHTRRGTVWIEHM